MTDQPLVSVIIPTYKRSELLRRAVDSVKNQTYLNVEIIVVDDANENKVRELFVNDTEVILLVNETNKGGCFSRNRGIKESKGEFINFLDDDDILYPTKIEKQVHHIQLNPNNVENLGFVTCHTNDGRSGEIVKKENRVKGNIHKNLLRKFSLTGIESVLYKKEALIKVDGFDEQMVSSQEYDLLIRISEYYNVDFVDEILTEEFKSEDQISINFKKKMKGARQIYKKHKHRMYNVGLAFGIVMRIKYELIVFKFYLASIFGIRFYDRFLR
jgi:glycosyltransferase involved in cell wall biosynthesis